MVSYICLKVDEGKEEIWFLHDGSNHLSAKTKKPNVAFLLGITVISVRETCLDISKHSIKNTPNSQGEEKSQRSDAGTKHENQALGDWSHGSSW